MLKKVTPAQTSSNGKSFKVVERQAVYAATSKSAWFFIYALIALMIALFVYIVGAYSQNLDKTELRIKQLEAIVDKLLETNDDSGTSYDFTGDYLKANLPDKWSIVEYAKGKGSNQLQADKFYTGLTGFVVKDELDKVVFAAEGYDKTMPSEVCATYYRFSDVDQEHAATVVGEAKLKGNVDTKIVDVAKGSFEESKLLGLSIRRIGTSLLWDIRPDKAGFATACGVVRSRVLNLPDVSFKSDRDKLANYMVTFGTTDVAKLLLLDSVFDSIVAK